MWPQGSCKGTSGSCGERNGVWQMLHVWSLSRSEALGYLQTRRSSSRNKLAELWGPSQSEEGCERMIGITFAGTDGICAYGREGGSEMQEKIRSIGYIKYILIPIQNNAIVSYDSKKVFYTRTKEAKTMKPYETLGTKNALPARSS